MNYGPVEPLEDPDAAAKLATLLQEGGLCPLDIDIQLFSSEPTSIEVWHPEGPYAIMGLTSRHTKEDDVKIIRAEILDFVVLRDVAASAFNLGHLVPNDLGVITRTSAPLLLTVECEAKPVLPQLAITLWGKIYDPIASRQLVIWQQGSRETQGRLSPYARSLPAQDFVNLMKALKALKANDVPVEDDDLRALLDKYASIL